MKPSKREFEVMSTLQGERVAMTIDQNALAHIINVLTDLYSDPEAAVIREYSTNAYDAHVEAGNPSPIEVTLPTSLAPFLRIRDYGDGLSADDIREVYSRYGASTKRESDDVVGMLGLGCKSALTYTNQFTVVGIKNGVRTQVSVSRDEDGSATMTILDQSETTDASGVEIIVPVSRYGSVAEKAQLFFRYWQPGTVLVNGEEPKQLDGVWVAKDLLLTDEVDQPMVVMGNVAYPLTDGNRYYSGPFVRNKHNVVVWVEIGAVHFTPSREALQMTQQTKRTISALETRVKDTVDTFLQSKIDLASDNYEAVRTYYEVRAMSPHMKPLFKGQEMVTQLATHRLEDGTLTERTKYTVVREEKEHRRRQYDVNWSVEAATWLNAVWLIGYESEKPSPTQIKKLEQWARTKNFNVRGSSDVGYYILVKDAPDTTWIDPKTFYNWQDVKDQKLPRDDRPIMDSGRLAGSFDVVTMVADSSGKLSGQMTYGMAGSDIDGSHNVCYYDPKRESMRTLGLCEGDVVVQLSPNRVQKFLRAFPHAKRLRVFQKEQYEAWLAQLGLNDRLALALKSNNLYYSYQLLDPHKVADPELARYARVAKRNIASLLKINSSFANVYGDDLASQDEDEMNHPLNKYPLVKQALGKYASISDEGDTYFYLNAKFAALTARKEQ